MKTHVLIAVPSLDGKIGAALTNFLCEAERKSLDADYPFGFSKVFLLGYRPVDYMRNAVFRHLLESDAERLWMLDADIVPPQSAFQMLGVDDDIVGGAIPGYRASPDGGIALRVLAFDQNDDGTWDSIDPPTSVRKVDGVGGGCMVIRRRVIEDERMRVAPDPPEAERDARWAPAIYRVRTEPWGALRVTGDLDFCERARACGYGISLWPDEMFGQNETLDLRDVAAYGARCAAGSTV